MNRIEQLRWMIDVGIVAIVRSSDAGQLVDVARALADGGVTVIEVTMTVPSALHVIHQVREALGQRLLLGAGTVLDPETARAAILAGADFIVAPTLNPETIRLCHRYDKAVLPGAFTPTEILTAWEMGADLVKVFPAEVLGPAFFKAVQAPLPQIRLMPTGGVNLQTAADFLKAGACCLGVGSQLVDPKRIATGDFQYLRDQAKRYVEVVQQTRASLSGKPESMHG
jgi:2-dehydro-3-deoxyphosphogluconate aldolase/(4S)-4-hydroxy-2-oxoglutarate aldolase